MKEQAAEPWTMERLDRVIANGNKEWIRKRLAKADALEAALAQANTENARPIVGGESMSQERDETLEQQIARLAIPLLRRDHEAALALANARADAAEIRATNANAGNLQLQMQLAEAIGRADRAERELDELIYGGPPPTVQALRRSEAAGQALYEALEALAKVQYDGTIEGLRYQIEREDWGDVLDPTERTEAYELTLAALANWQNRNQPEESNG